MSINLSAAQEERLQDVANMSPRPRGTMATAKALRNKGLIVFDDNRMANRLTHYGEAVLAAIRERSPR